VGNPHEAIGILEIAEAVDSGPNPVGTPGQTDRVRVVAPSEITALNCVTVFSLFVIGYCRGRFAAVQRSICVK
jgi:hypothetical protein